MVELIKKNSDEMIKKVNPLKLHLTKKRAKNCKIAFEIHRYTRRTELLLHQISPEKAKWSSNSSIKGA